MQNSAQSQQVSDRSGVRCERFFHLNLPSVMAAKSLIYPQMSAYYDCDANYFRSRSSHLGLLLMHVTAGRLAVCGVRGEVEAGPGDTVLLETFRTHLYCAAQGTSPSFYWLHFDGVGARPLAEYLIHRNQGICFSLPNEYSQRFSHLILDLSKENLPETEQSARIYALLCAMERPNLERTPCQKAVDYLQGHYAEGVRIADLAAAAHLSASHFCACFKEEYGVSPHQYLIEYRLSIGHNLVCNTAQSIEEIYPQIGYSSPSAFIAAFSKKYGSSPSALRTRLYDRAARG